MSELTEALAALTPTSEDVAKDVALAQAMKEAYDPKKEGFDVPAPPSAKDDSVESVGNAQGAAATKVDGGGTAEEATSGAATPPPPPKLPATLEREEMQKRLEVAQSWSKVWTIEASTAKLKIASTRLMLARLPQEEATAAEHKAKEAELEAQEATLSTKRTKEEDAVAKQAGLQADLTTARANEIQALESRLKEYRETIETVKTYRSPLLGGEREVFYFSDCHRKWGMGKRYCELLSKRAAWRKFPSQSWFMTKEKEEIFCPAGNVTVDFSDQSVYSMSQSNIKGHHWIDNKAKIYDVVPSYMPRTYVVRDGEWDSHYGVPNPNESPGIWFLKEVEANYATGVFTYDDPAECLAHADKEKVYVVQPHLQDLLLWDERGAELCGTVGAKFHIRAYTIAYSPPGGRHLEFWIHPQGHVSVGSIPWTPRSKEWGCQITRDRSGPWHEWYRYEETYPLVKNCATRIFEALATKLDPPTKGSFQLFGTDFVLDRAMRPWMIEINAGPCVKDGDNPILEKMLEIVLPDGVGETRSTVAPEWEKISECEAGPPQVDEAKEAAAVDASATASATTEEDTAAGSGAEATTSAAAEGPVGGRSTSGTGGASAGGSAASSGPAGGAISDSGSGGDILTTDADADGARV